MCHSGHGLKEETSVVGISEIWDGLCGGKEQGEGLGED